MSDENKTEGGEGQPENLSQEELKGSAGAAQAQSIEFLLDVPLSLSVELGRAKMLVNDLLQLGQGSVIELTKIVGEPLEVMVNNKLIARGEVVTLNDKFAVRLTDIISPTDRLDSLT
ncbi:MAG: flagellar motor switch protein FliN [Bradymonadales bacterium]|nr:MAG: flagellar motor switch protein FliN [Bradymonadales bacterium]